MFTLIRLLSKHILGATGAKAAQVAAQAGVLLALGHHSGAFAVGHYSLGLALTAPVFLFWQMGLRHVAAADADERYSPILLLVQRTISISVGVLVAFLCFIFLKPMLGLSGPVIAAAISLKAADSLSDLSHGFMQRSRNAKMYFYSLAGRAMFSFIAFCAGLLIFDSYVHALAAYAGSWWVWAIAFDLVYLKAAVFGEGMRVVLPYVTPQALGKLTRDLLPLAGAALLISLGPNVPRYTLGYYETAEAVGYYSLAAYAMTAGALIANGIGQGALPFLASYVREGKASSFFITVAFAASVLILSCFAMVFASLFHGEEFWRLVFDTAPVEQVEGVLLGLSVATGLSFVGTINYYVLMALQARAEHFWIHLVGVVVVVAAASLCVPVWSLDGAVIAIIALYFSQAVISAFAVWRAFNTIRPFEAKTPPPTQLGRVR